MIRVAAQAPNRAQVHRNRPIHGLWSRIGIVRPLVLALAMAAAATGGCGAPPADTDAIEADLAAAPAQDIDLALAATRVAPDLRDGRAAAMRVATMPRVSDPATRAEIALHAALARVGGADLESAMEADAAAARAGAAPTPGLVSGGLPGRDRDAVLGVILGTAPATLAIPPQEAALRIVARLEQTDLHGRPAARWRLGPASGGTVAIRIDSRAEDHAEVAATLTATARQRSTRRPVRAFWDGQEWIVETIGPITEW